MVNPFTPLWQYLPKVGSKIWKYNPSDSEVYNPKRAALELVCGALWHLELAAAIGKFSKRKMIHFLKGGRENCQPWEIWRERSKGPSSKFNKNELVIEYCFSKPPTASISFLIQSMLVANAALRLYGAREVLRDFFYEKDQKKLSNPLVACSRSINNWIRKDNSTFSFEKSKNEIKKHVTMVVTFRDAYIHGEVPYKSPKKLDMLVRFRKEFFAEYSLAEVVKSCREVWKELVKLASGGTGFLH